MGRSSHRDWPICKCLVNGYQKKLVSLISTLLSASARPAPNSASCPHARDADIEQRYIPRALAYIWPEKTSRRRHHNGWRCRSQGSLRRRVRQGPRHSTAKQTVGARMGQDGRRQ